MATQSRCEHAIAICRRRGKDVGLAKTACSSRASGRLTIACRAACPLPCTSGVTSFWRYICQLLIIAGRTKPGNGFPVERLPHGGSDHAHSLGTVARGIDLPTMTKAEYVESDFETKRSFDTIKAASVSSIFHAVAIQVVEWEILPIFLIESPKVAIGRVRKPDSAFLDLRIVKLTGNAE